MLLKKQGQGHVYHCVTSPSPKLESGNWRVYFFQLWMWNSAPFLLTIQYDFSCWTVRDYCCHTVFWALFNAAQSLDGHLLHQNQSIWDELRPREGILDVVNFAWWSLNLCLHFTPIKCSGYYVVTYFIHSCVIKSSTWPHPSILAFWGYLYHALSW